MDRNEKQGGPVAVIDREVDALRARIQHWRRTRAKRTAMPENLWAAAVELTGDRDVYPVARALKLNYDTLRARVLETELARRPERGDDCETAFVELDALQVFGAPPERESVVEVIRVDGSRMTIRTHGVLDVASLSAAFVGGCR